MIKGIEKFKTITKENKLPLAMMLSSLTTMQTLMAAQTDVGINMKSGFSNFLVEIADIYTSSLCWPFFLVCGGCLALSHNDKIVGFAKKGLWAGGILYVVCKILLGGDGNIIQNTFNTISQWFGASGQ